MFRSNNPFLGKGLYTIHEASRLTGADRSTMRRWLLGYRYKNKAGEYIERPPIFTAEFGEIDGQFIISFQDLVELLFVTAFRKKGIRWAVIHEAFELAKVRFKSNHPFSVINFKTDGRRIFEEIVERGRTQLTDLQYNQLVMAPIIEPSLQRAIEFEFGKAITWFPLHPSKVIVLDPSRSFGRPIISRTGVPVETIYAAFEADEDIRLVAKEFDTPTSDVRAAIGFQSRMAA